MQESVARAEATLRSARAFLFDTIDECWREAEAGFPTVDKRRDLRLAAANAVWEAVRVVDAMYSAAGGASVHSSSPLQRCLRDAHVVTQHRMVNLSMFELTGRLYLNGAELRDTAFL
jgi:alkylation response protein AidB-like acyl-CoA dehydrogenase